MTIYNPARKPVRRKTKHVSEYMSYCNSISVYLLTLLSLFFCSQSVVMAEEEFPWPIDSAKRISSTFGEPRPGRFHYGVDFKSGGITGKKVYALGDGYISGIRTSPFGYGKMLYLTLDSGKVVLYGHLSRFMPEIENRLFKMRIAQGTYDVQMWPKPGQYKVRRGQVVAYSGDTGNGPPHLHIEILEDRNVPLNLLGHGIFVRDTIAPEIRSVVIIPLDKSSSVDGFPFGRWCDFSSEPFVVNGRIGIAASVHDRADLSDNHLSIYQISLAVDSTQVFSKKYDRIPYSFNGFGNLDYLPGYKYGGQNELSALFRRTGNGLDFYEGDGIIFGGMQADGKEIVLTVSAKDYTGNTTERSFPVIFGMRPVITTCSFIESGKIHIAGKHMTGKLERVEVWEYGAEDVWTLERVIPAGETTCYVTEEFPSSSRATYKIILVGEDSRRSMPCIITHNPDLPADKDSTAVNITTELDHDRIVVRVESTDVLASLPEIQVEHNGVLESGFLIPVPDGEKTWVTSLTFSQSGQTRYRILTSAVTPSLNLVRDTVSLEFTGIEAGRETTVSSPDNLFSLTVRDDTLYRSAPVMVDTVSVNTSNSLRLISGGYRVVWGDVPLKRSCKVMLELEDNPHEKAALYSLRNENVWGFLSAEHNGRFFTGELGGSGYIAVLVDEHRPYVASLVPRPGSTITSRQPLLSAYVEDKGSGIKGSDSFTMSIDGIPIYGEYDFEANQIGYRLHNPLRPGKHTVKLTVTDRMGNSITKTWSFSIAG
ncbi:M23 family metallopeptidase [Candidatus Latescibacterota bacterium]